MRRRALAEQRDERRMGTKEEGGVWTEEGPRGHPQDGWSGRQKESTRGERGGHPRDAQAPCEGGKAGESCSLRPGHLAVLRREWSKGVGRLRALAKMKRDGKRIVAAGRQEERGRSSRGEGVKACARDEGAQGVKERNPWKSRGECFVAVTDPLAVARARQSTFSARESRRRRASQHRAIVARSAR